MTDALIFDLDGTLWDSTVMVADAWNRALEELRIDRTITAQDIRDIAGLTYHEIFLKKFPELGEEKREHLAERCTHYEHEFSRREPGILYPGVKAGIPQLAEKNKLYIVSNCQTEYLLNFFATSGLGAHFRDWECHGRTGRKKGENLADLIRRNDLKQPVYIGDTRGDREAAAFAKVPFLWARYGFGNLPGEFAPLTNPIPAAGEFLLPAFADLLKVF